MAYQTEDLFEEALKIVRNSKPHSFNMLISIMGISKETFFNHFPPKSNRHKEIQQAINHEKGKVKANMMKKWFDSDKPGLQIAYFRLLADADELRALSMRHQSFEVPEDLEIEIKIHPPKDDD